MMPAADTYHKLFDVFPNAQIDTDNDGQVIVYTNMKEQGRLSNGQPEFLVDMDEKPSLSA